MRKNTVLARRTCRMKKKKPETTVDTIDEKEPAAKERFCVKCKMKLASDNKLPFCPACWENIMGYVRKARLAAGALALPLLKKYGPKVGKAALTVLKMVAKK